MKAWHAHDAKSYEDYSTIVFAETRSEAKLAAMATDTCCKAEYIDIRVRRLPEADKLYKGSSEIDWWDKETRLFLVRDLGWACFETSEDCDICPAREFCSQWEDER